MSKTKKWLIAAAFLLLTGCIIFGSAMTTMKWDFNKLSTEKLETTEYVLNEDFNSISINTDTADVFFLPSENNKVKVVCYEFEKQKHIVEAKNGVLTINEADERKWYEYIGITLGSPKITVYLPEGEYASLLIKERTGNVEIPEKFKFKDIDITVSTGNVKCYASALESVKIKASTGDIDVGSISTARLELSVSTGKVTASEICCTEYFEISVSTGKTDINDASCKNFISKGTTGDISMKNVIASDKFSIRRSTGDVKFYNCDAEKIFVVTGTGSVKGTLISDKVFITETNTGSINVPKSTVGGRCEITTTTGDIKINIEQ